MKRWRCADPRARFVLLVLTAIVVLIVTLVLYLYGWRSGARLLCLYALLLRFVFALAGAAAVAFVLYRLLRRWCARCGKPPKGKGTREDTGPVVAHLPPSIHKRPDPLIYSQFFLKAQGLAFTWNNPDIWLTELPDPNGVLVPVDSYDLAPDHTYRVHARVYNGSLEAPAVGLPVVFSYLSFGIGTVSNPIGARTVNLPVKGASGHPQVTFHDWKTPAAGHYCLQVRLIWPDDSQPGNNLGQENVQVKKLNSPKAEFTFPLRNDGHARRLCRLEVDAYPPPVPPACPDGATAPTAAAWRERIAAHRPEAHPLPPGWSVTFSPGPEHLLGPGEEVEITATVLVAENLPTPRPVNVNAVADGALAGGVTLY